LVAEIFSASRIIHAVAIQENNEHKQSPANTLSTESFQSKKH